MDFNFDPIPHILHQEFGNDITGRLFVYWLSINLKQYSYTKTVTKKKFKVYLEPNEFIFGRTLCSEEAFITEKQVRNRIDKMKKLGWCIEVESKSRNEFSVYRFILKGQPESQGELQEKGQPEYQKGQPEGQPKGQPDETSKLASQLFVDELLSKENILKGQPKGQPKGHLLKEAKESEESLSIDKERFTSPSFHGKDRSPFSRLNGKYSQVSAVDIEKIQDLAEANHFKISYQTVKIWLTKYDFLYIMEHLELMFSRDKKKKIDEQEKWMEGALKENYIKETKDKKMNREYAIEFKLRNHWGDLKIQSRGVLNEKYHTDFSFELDHGKFKELLQKEYLKR